MGAEMDSEELTREPIKRYTLPYANDIFKAA